MDGASSGHPDQNEIAVQQFPYPNQLDRRPALDDPHLDLRPLPTGVGTKTLAGTRAAARTVIRYRNGVLNGRGASLLDGYMEDLATDRIYRLMIAQRVHHWEVIRLSDARGQPLKHTPELVSELFDQELNRILRELPPDIEGSAIDKFCEARYLSELMIQNGEFDPI